ncbi:MAG: P-type conjugative transfer protein TrbL, partial [Brevundimonas sp.]
GRSTPGPTPGPLRGPGSNGPSGPGPGASGRTAGAPGAGGVASGGSRPAAQIAREGEAARRDFHRAAAESPGDDGGRGLRRAGRSGALQAFFIANSGRSLMPASEASGALSPRLKAEDR